MKDEQSYSIFVSSIGKRIPVSEEVFKSYMRENDSYRRRMIRSNQCKCPTSKSTGCDTDCESCPYHCQGSDVESLEDTLMEDEECDDEFGDFIVSEEIEPWDDLDGETHFSRQERYVRMLKRMKELMPDAEKIAHMLLEKKSLLQSCRELGLDYNHVVFQLQRLKRRLKKEFKDWL